MEEHMPTNFYIGFWDDSIAFLSNQQKLGRPIRGKTVLFRLKILSPLQNVCSIFESSWFVSGILIARCPNKRTNHTHTLLFAFCLCVRSVFFFSAYVRWNHSCGLTRKRKLSGKNAMNDIFRFNKNTTTKHDLSSQLHSLRSNASSENTQTNGRSERIWSP